MKDILKCFASYPLKHPFREWLLQAYDADLNPKLPIFGGALNSMQALVHVLQYIRFYSPEAFNSMVGDKLAARNGAEGVDYHNLVAALCELSVMYAFISASDCKESFKYEPRLIEGERKNVEFSIEIRGLLFEVEVKSANMLKQNEDFVRAMSATGEAIELNTRMLPLEDWRIMAEGTPLLVSLDNKVADFLKSTQAKFPSVGDSIHLLVICWDSSYIKALSALKSNINGLLTMNTYMPDLKYDHISHIIVTDQYGLIASWLQGGLGYFHAMDPLSLRFANNFLIDYNLDKPEGIRNYLTGILSSSELPVVDEDYVLNNCPDIMFSVDI